MDQMADDINIIVEKTLTALLDHGFAKQSVYGGHYNCIRVLQEFFNDRGGKYRDEIMEAYMSMLRDWRESGKVGHGYYLNLLRVAERVMEMYKTGKLEWSCRTRLSKFKLNKEFERVLDGFLSHYRLHHNTRGDFIWVIRKYLSYLQLHGINKISEIATEDITKYIIHCSEQMSRGTMHDIICYTKRFHKYLDETDQLSIPYLGVLSISVRRNLKIQQPISTDEINAILGAVDTNTSKGKRDYAIILLGTVLGLRAVDIVNLKLRDIDWAREEVRVLQQKTGRTVLLPLTAEVADAVKAYILCGRPEASSEYIFLRLRAPIEKIRDSRSIGNMFELYQRQSGVKRTAFDGKGFHSLRRHLGLEMTLENTPVTTVAQVLGHGSISTAQQYISLSTDHLRECALDLSGICVTLGDAI